MIFFTNDDDLLCLVVLCAVVRHVTCPVIPDVVSLWVWDVLDFSIFESCLIRIVSSFFESKIFLWKRRLPETENNFRRLWLRGFKRVWGGDFIFCRLLFLIERWSYWSAGDPREMIWSYTLGRFTKDFLAAVASMSRRDSLSSRSSHLIDWKTKNLNSVFHDWESSRHHPRYDWFLRARASTTPHIFRIPPKVTRPRNLIIKSSARGRKDSKINELREEKRDDTTKVFLQYIFIAIAAEEFANVNKFCQ